MRYFFIDMMCEFSSFYFKVCELLGTLSVIAHYSYDIHFQVVFYIFSFDKKRLCALFTILCEAMLMTRHILKIERFKNFLSSDWRKTESVTFSVLCCNALNFAWMRFVKGIPSLKYSRHSRRMSIPRSTLLHALKSPAGKKSLLQLKNPYFLKENRKNNCRRFGELDQKGMVYF